MKRALEVTGNARTMHRLNKVSIINIIRNNEAISRAGIAKRSRLSAPTVSRIVEDLITEGLVTEIGEGKSSGGRRPTLLKFSGSGNYVIGIDLGTTNIYGVLSDLDANIIAEIRCATHVEEGFHAVMQRTAGVIDDLKDHLKTNGKKILGIGMAVAGLINRQRNNVAFSPDFHWHNVDVVGELSQWHDIPVIFDNVTRVMALGEVCYGIGKRIKNFVCVNVGYGIGAGIIIHGRPLYGPIGMAGEFGHLTLEKDSDIQCDCGNFGCLEALASGNAIAKAARKRTAAGERTLLSEMCGGDPARITAKMVADAAKQGDSLAWSIFNQAMDYIGVGIAGLINLFSPEAVIIGGGVAQAGDILFDRIRKVVRARGLQKIAGHVAIQPAHFGLRAAVMGAVSLILSDVINQNDSNHVSTHA